MGRRKEIIAIVGGGKGGHNMLQTLLRMPGVEVRYMYDPNPKAPGMVLAGQHGIFCSTDTTYPELWANAAVSVILEVTGSEAVFRSLGGIKSQTTSLIGARGNRMVFGMLEAENKVLQRLEEYQGKLEELVTQRTSELEQANLELSRRVREFAALNRKLETLNQEKTRYLLRSTHQLKAPFAAIQSYTDLILKGYTGEIPAKTRVITDKIRQRCGMLTIAIHEMLQLASLQALEVSQMETQMADLNLLIGRSIERHAILAQAAGVKLIFAPAPRSIKVRCNPAHLGALFDIFIKNAIDYSPSGKTIRVGLTLRDGHVAARVRDQGIGIRPDARKKIFDEFYRTNEAADKEPNGTGLGLAIAAHIANLHGFRIRLRSTVGKGSTFSVIMPVGRSARTRRQG